MAGSYEHNNEPPGTIKGDECLSNPSDYLLLTKNTSQSSYLVSVEDIIWCQGKSSNRRMGDK
jgi:hypothetical protein